jgi:hypothetical protein
MICSCCGVEKELYEFYRIPNGYRKKCQQCTKEQLKNRYKTDKEHRKTKVEYARMKNPLRDRSLKGAMQ